MEVGHSSGIQTVKAADTALDILTKHNTEAMGYG